VLRHGNGNLVERNIFLGKGVADTGGVRVINRDQIVRGNYFEGLAGTAFKSAISVMTGVPNSVINRYHPVANARIETNSVIDSARITLAAGADAERSAPPTDSRFERNLIVGANGADPFRAEGDIGGIAFAGNVEAKVAAPLLTAGITAGIAGGLLLLPALAASFAGVVLDPVQVHLRLHQRRLHRLIDSLERELKGSGDSRFVIRDHYVARVLDLIELARTAIPRR